MKNRFKLTTGFLVVSVAIFAIAAVVITQSARRNEEANLVDVVSEQSSRDARVIAGVVTGMAGASELTSTGIGAPSDAADGFESLAMATFLSNSNIVRFSLFNADGSLIWSSSPGSAMPGPASNGAFAHALTGETVTVLDRDVEYLSFDGEAKTSDLTSTFVPLLDASTQKPSQVLEVARDITATLDARIESARSSMFRTVFSTLGGTFIVLFGVVLTADVLLSHSRQRAVFHERALADEKIVASKLELENQQLRQLNEERDRFLSMVSHELRTPLTTIMGFTDVLRRRQDGERKESNVKHLELMRRNGEHLNSLIEDMLEITRIQAGKFEVVKEGFSLDRLIDEVRESGRVLLKARRQVLRVEKNIDGMELHGDRRRVMQVMLNLLSNASKYSPEDTIVTLKVEQSGGSVQISVGDQGAGIPEDDCKLLFERFYRRNDEATRAQSGLGLGLSIVKAIVDAHRGEVDVQSTVGVGTVMTVTLPGARKVVQQTQTAMSPDFEIEMARLERLRDLRSLPAGARAAS